MPDDNVTPLRPAEDPPPASAAPETFAGPGWTGQVIYPGGAPPRVPSSDPPPPETMPSAAAEGAREDLDDAAAELARRVHGPVPPDRPQCGYTMDESVNSFRLCLAPAGHDGDHVPSERIRRGEPDVPPMPSRSSEPVRYAKVGDPTFDTREPPDEVPVDPEGDAAYWRARAEAAEDRMAVAEGAHLGLQTRILAAEALADALEALAGNVRPLVPRLPVRQREPIYQAHGRALEALAAYRKAGA